ncbi:MAG: hypothetical protein QM661_13645 [Solimonas sp.]
MLRDERCNAAIDVEDQRFSWSAKTPYRIDLKARRADAGHAHA